MIARGLRRSYNGYGDERGEKNASALDEAGWPKIGQQKDIGRMQERVIPTMAEQPKGQEIKQRGSRMQ